MKILYVTTVGITMNFFKSLISELKMSGNEVDIACNDSLFPVDDYYKNLGCNIYTLSCTRSPFNLGVLKAIKEIINLVKYGNYDIVHCHTPIASMCTRIACRKARKLNTKVIYTAHGFHFYKGAPKKNWIIYYPIEKICSYFTDILITINKEDYTLAKRKFKAKKVEFVPGVGINVKHFSETSVDFMAKRDSLGIPNNAFLLLSVGELNQNKNHELVIRAVASLNDKNIHYMVAGDGILKEQLIDLSKKLGIESQIHLLGQRSDVSELYKVADVYVHPSFREGLPVSVIEALASGCPIICTDIRGNTDIVVDNRNGIVVKAGDVKALKNAVIKIKTEKKDIGSCNSLDALKYDISVINNQMINLYFG